VQGAIKWYVEWFAAGTVFLSVVDPGVGGTRPPIILEADGRWYVGPATDYSSWLNGVPRRCLYPDAIIVRSGMPLIDVISTARADYGLVCGRAPTVDLPPRRASRGSMSALSPLIALP
jgi:hypothetical protein